MRSQHALAAVLLSASLAAPARAAGIQLELEYNDDNSGYQRGSVELHAWLTVDQAIAEAHVKLRINPAYVSDTSLTLDDRYWGPGLSAEPTVDGDVASVDVIFAAGHLPPVGERVKAFIWRLCVESPTPHTGSGWDFPAELVEATAVPAAGGEPVAMAAAVPAIRVYWGQGNPDAEFACYHEPHPPIHVQCVTQPDGTVLLTWTNPEPYDEIQIYTRTLRAERREYLPGDATSWLDEDGGAEHNFVYEVGGVRSTGETSPRGSDSVRCTATDPRPQVSFVRGDVNADGVLSTADMVALERWALSLEFPVTCIDATDVDDDGQHQLRDVFAIAYYLFGAEFRFDGGFVDGGEQPPAPFPAAGIDPTHAGEEPYMTCDSYTVTPGEATDDVIRIGDVEATAGSEAYIPVYLTNARPIEAVQLVLRYDSTVLRVAPGADSVRFDGTYFEQFKGQWMTYVDSHQHSSFYYGEPSAHVAVDEEAGIITAAVIGHMIFPRLLAVPPGVDTLVAKIRVEVSPDVAPGTELTIDPVDGGYGRFGLRNELTYQGDARYATILPHHEGGLFRIGVDGDVSFFVRGDANGDRQVDLSDAVTILGFLFTGAEKPGCLDAADADDSGDLLITDAIVVLTHLFTSSTGRIAPPFPEAGTDPRPDFLERCRR